MGLDIPAIYAVYPRQSQPIRFSNDWEVTDLLSKLGNWKDPAAAGICICTCHNYWHQTLLKQICKGGKIQGLDFVWEIPSYICLHDAELKTAYAGITQIVGFLSSGLPDLGEWEDDNIKDFRYCRDLIGREKGESRNDNPERYLQAFEQAEVQLHIDSESWGFESNKAFCSHIKTLHSKISEAIERDDWFVYVLPKA
jgi:hypothetical protein